MLSSNGRRDHDLVQMNWLLLLKYLAPALLLFVVYSEYKLKHRVTDGRTIEYRRTSKTKFLVLAISGIIGLIALGADDWIKFNKDKEATADKSKLNSQITNLTFQVSEQATQINTINASQRLLAEQNQMLLQALATNSSIGLDLREGILDANKKFEVVDSQVVDLNQLKTKLESQRASQEIQHEKEWKAAQSEYDLGLPIYEYTVRTLIEMLGKVAVMKGDKAVSNYRGLALAVSPTLGETNVAEIKFQTNADWDFQVFVTGADINRHRGLSVKCHDVSLDVGTIEFGSNRFDTFLHVPGEEDINIRGSVDDYKKTVDEALGNLIAAEEMRFSNTNNATHP
jgi:hypothetical protein